MAPPTTLLRNLEEDEEKINGRTVQNNITLPNTVSSWNSILFQVTERISSLTASTLSSEEIDTIEITSRSPTKSSILEPIIYGTIQNLTSSSLTKPLISSTVYEHENVEVPFDQSLLFINNETGPTGGYWPLRDPLTIVIPITIIYSVILLIGLLGNVVTCVVIVRSRYLHTATNYYLFSLAISDLLLLLSGLPSEMHSIWRRYPDKFGEVFCIARGLFSETSANATVLTITAFTVERYLAICRPFFVQKFQNKLSRVVKQILVIWIVSIGLAIPQALQLGLVPLPVRNGEEALICSVKTILVEHSFEIATFVFFVGPMILITALYCLIGYTLRNASRVKESKLRLRKSLSGHKREVGQQRVLKMLVAVVAAFFICWAPFHAQRLIAIWGVTWLESSEALKNTYHILTYISGVLYYMSTCINPILYHIMSLKFRHAFQEMVNNGCVSTHEIGKRRRERNAFVGNGQIFDRSLSSRSSRSANVLILTEMTSTGYLNNNCSKQLHQAHHLSPIRSPSLTVPTGIPFSSRGTPI